MAQIARRTDLERPARRARQAGEEVARSDQLEWLARAGLVTRGVVYGIVGVLAIELATGAGTPAPASQQGALRTLAQQPLGGVLVLAAAIGLGGYALWRLVRAAIGRGPEQRDEGRERIDSLVTGISYAVLCATAVAILIGSGGASSGSPRKPTADVLGWPGGRWLVGLAGVVLMVVALVQAYQGATLHFLEQAKRDEMGPATERCYVVLGVVGNVARAVVLGLVGWFLLRAAIDFSPKQAVGVDGALANLARSPLGPSALAVVAGGWIAFGLHSLLAARYERV